MNTAIDKRDPAGYPSDSPPGFSGSKVFVYEEAAGFAVEAYLKGLRYGKR